MNFQKIYSNSIGREPKEEVVKRPEVEDASMVQAKVNWLESDITKALFKDIIDEANDLVEQAIAGACSYPTHNNHNQIIHSLVRANELRNLVTKYGRPT